ncbi:MAG: DUF2304 domain-containing protein [Candidatus Omnitrophota bacterium]
MTPTVLSMILLVLLLAVILDFIRRDKLTFKYAFGWLTAVVLGLLCAVFQNAFRAGAELLGFVLLSNAIFFFCVFLAVVLGVLLTVFLCQLNRRNEQMAQKIGLLEKRVLDAEGGGHG